MTQDDTAATSTARYTGKFTDLFSRPKPIIGMVHHATAEGNDRLGSAIHDLETYAKTSIDGVILENHPPGEEIDVIRTFDAIKKERFPFKFGINILPNEFDRAFTLVKDYDLDFIQLDHIAGQYFAEPQPLQLPITRYNQYRNSKEHRHVVVIGGVHPKYYIPLTPLGADIDAAMRRCDAIAITGDKTGQPPELEKIDRFRRFMAEYDNQFPLVMASGLTDENAPVYLGLCDGFIVGSTFKKDGRLGNPVDGSRVHMLTGLRDRLFRS